MFKLLKNKIIFISLLLLLIIVILIGIKPKIYLIGEDKIEISLGNVYKEKGATAYILYKDISNNVQVKDNININKVGTYKVKYQVKYLNHTYKKYRTVEVIDDIEPVITLKGDTDLTLCPNQEYQEQGYEVTDNYDKNLKEKVIVQMLNDKIVYRVKDQSGNIGIARRNILYKDNEKPNISLNDGNITLYLGEKYKDPGYEITDNCDTSIIKKVKIEGEVDSNKVGTYEIKYSVVDDALNKSEITRIVEVIKKPKDTKVIYLTFDDGPSKTITPEILKILNEEKIKATFFVINHNDDLNYLIKEEYDSGHAVALHSYTHDYKYIYTSEDNYFSDLEAIKNKVKDITNYNSNIIRFPGGSSNRVSRFNPGIMSRLAIETKNKGYIYFDWNVDSMDAGGAKTKEEVYNNVINHLNDKINIVLMHDFEKNYKTLDALRDIIKYGKENGYTFEKITTSTKQIKHGITN